METETMPQKIIDAMDELTRSYELLMDAQDAFNHVCKQAAAGSGFDAAVIKAYVASKVKDTVEAQKRRIDQLGLLLEM